MNLTQRLHRLGGVAARSALVRLTSRAEVDRALRAGEIVQDGRGRYALPNAKLALRAANALAGVASHPSAAAYWGWEMKHPPDDPIVTVPRNRNVSADRRGSVTVTWATLKPDEIVNGVVTAKGRTLVDCGKTLPFDEALAIVDSALRNKDIDERQLDELAEQAAGPGSLTFRRAASEANAKAANPFESVLRAIALDIPGLNVTPQLLIDEGGFWARPDLVDEQLRLVLEADSFEWHGSRKAFMRDCRRYNGLVLRGWRVFRFSWEDVMLHPAYVVETLRSATGHVDEHAQTAVSTRITA